jgi:hypothetical protein
MPIRSDGTHPSFLNEIEETNLNFLRGLIDFINKESPEVSLYRESGSGFKRAGERALYVTEQFTLHEIGTTEIRLIVNEPTVRDRRALMNNSST